jgi:hypothetical protein
LCVVTGDGLTPRSPGTKRSIATSDSGASVEVHRIAHERGARQDRRAWGAVEEQRLRDAG